MNQAIGKPFEEEENRIDRKPSNSGTEPVILRPLTC
jgi:hypothetical protein